jgi:hypothetical protein
LKRHRVSIASLVVLLLALPNGLGAAVGRTQAGPQPIYAAFSLLKVGKLRMQRCGAYSVTTGTYTGRSASPDPRMAGVVTWVGRIVLYPSGSTGVVTGALTIRDSGRTVRMRSGVSGVITNRSTVNGIVSGSLVGPGALLLANLTMVFDEELGFAAVRLGFESGQNSGISYPTVPKCR